jgi:LysR family transcriptional regulator for metE and metH
VDLEVRHLRLVSTVATVGGLTKAGRQLNLSQSALSHQLRDIEARLGTPLFLRVGKRMVLTAAGERLHRSADDILRVLEGTETAIRRLAGSDRGRLRVSVAGYAQFEWLPAVLKAYHTACPQVDVQLVHLHGADSVTPLLDGSIDIVIAPAAAGDSRLRAVPLFDDQIVLIVAPAHRLASRPFVQPHDLSVETLYLDAAGQQGAIYRHVVGRGENAFAGVQLVATTSATLELVKSGDGVALVGAWTVQPLVRAGAVRALRLTRRGLSHAWSAVTLRTVADSTEVRRFIELAGREMSKLTKSRSRRQ